MGGEISVYDNETNEEIALLEVEMSFSHIKYVMRFRYKEDKYTFSHKHLWKTSEFEWRNEAEQELMRIQQKWNWFKQETVMEVNTQLVPEDEVALLSVLGIMVIQYYNSGQGT